MTMKLADLRGGNSLVNKNGPLSTPIYQTSTFEITYMRSSCASLLGQLRHALR
jgi:hypothetical protein